MPEEKPAVHDSQFLDPNQILKHLNLEEGMYIADFGAGSGYMTFQAADLVGPTGKVYALDVKKSVIEHIANEIKERQLTNVKAVWTDLELVGKNPIPASTIDVVMIVNMLFQSTRHFEIMKEAKRVLKPAGRTLVIDWEKRSAPFGPPVDERLNLDQFKEMTYNLGLNKVQEFEAGPYHFGLIFRK